MEDTLLQEGLIAPAILHPQEGQSPAPFQAKKQEKAKREKQAQLTQNAVDMERNLAKMMDLILQGKTQMEIRQELNIGKNRYYHYMNILAEEAKARRKQLGGFLLRRHLDKTMLTIRRLEAEFGKATKPAMRLRIIETIDHVEHNFFTRLQAAGFIEKAEETIKVEQAPQTAPLFHLVISNPQLFERFQHEQRKQSPKPPIEAVAVASDRQAD